MEIGQKLKSARVEAGLTQETVAEKIGVSRQTISNWENNRYYPDIISVISLSDLYSISLDELLKEDKKMIQYLEESTDVVKSRQKVSKLILSISYLLVWALSILVFWIGGASDAMGYSIVTFYLVLPITTFIISIFIGKDDGWANHRWSMLLFFGFMYMVASYATFSLSNMLSFEKVNAPELEGRLPGILSAGLGMFVGSVLRLFVEKRKK